MLAALTLLIALQTPLPTTLNVDGVPRQAIFVPARNATSAGAPLVFVFHGHGGNMRYAYRKFDIHDLWPEAVVVYPEGLPTKGMTDPEGKKNGWQQNAGDEIDRDLRFFDRLLDYTKTHYKIDNRRIYAMGHSNGGRFTYLLWAERGGIFAAFSPAASPATRLVPKLTAKPAFIIAGEQDAIVPFASQEFSIRRVRQILGTDASKATKSGYASYELGAKGIELGTYIYPGGHNYPDEAAKLTVDFFKRHSK